VVADHLDVIDGDRFLATGTITLGGTTTVADGNAAVTASGSTVLALVDQGVAIVSTGNPTPNPPPVSTGTPPIAIGGALSDLVIAGAGQSAYATNTTTNAVAVVSLATKTVVANIPVGSMPAGLDLTPDGTKLYVANSGADNISVVDVATRSELRRITVPPA